MNMTEFIDAIGSKSAPATPDQVEAFEKELDERLPEDYRQFLLACNGGHVGGRLWFQGVSPDGGKVEAGVHHVGGFRAESYFSLNRARQAYRERIAAPLTWVMDDPFGNAICLGVAGKYRGRVYFWDHENEPDDDWDGRVETAGNLTLLANSFADFVSGLCEPKDDVDEAREAVELGKLPARLESQCRGVESQYPDIRHWIRALCLKIFDEKGFLAVHADELSRTLIDLAFWLNYSTSGVEFTTSKEACEIMSAWYWDDNTKFGLGGYAPGFIDQWWQDRLTQGLLQETQSGVRFTPEAERDLLSRLRTMARD